MKCSLRYQLILSEIGRNMNERRKEEVSLSVFSQRRKPLRVQLSRKVQVLRLKVKA